jgi:tRNA threonylcarbamoyladenosine modification (KEOPS) complex  Pcc1 subunit
MAQCIESLRKTGNVRPAAPRGFLGLHLAYGNVQNVILKWPQGLMILARRHCRAEIRFSFRKDYKRSRSLATAAFTALSPDTKNISGANSSISKIFLNDHTITIQVEANDIACLRANINTYFRLFRLCVHTLSDS